jgi:NADPH-dependent F420 reductase
MKVGIVGGTGPAGSGLAVRLAAAGHEVLLGSRDHDKAAQRVAELQAKWSDRVATLHGVANADATHADVVVLATVADSVVATATDLAAELDGRVVVCMANLLTRVERGFAAVLPEDGSVAVNVQQVVPGARIVGAYQNLPARALAELEQAIEADVVVCGDDAEAVATVVELTATVDGLRPFDGGPLVNAAAIEALTAVLLTVNRARKGEHGIRLVDLRAKLG